MKDELEALLEDEEALEAELAQVLAHRTFYYYRKKETSAAETASVAEVASEAGNGETAGVGVYQTPALVREPVFWAWSGNDTVIVEQQSGETALSAPAGGAEALYLGLIRARQAAGYRRPAESRRIPLVKGTNGFTASGLDAAGMDQIFQRDARRYDGGFKWQ